MREIWDHLATCRREKALCASEVEAIRNSCRQTHKHRHVIECVECYERILDRMQSRYTTSPDADCFAAKDGFRKELQELFLQARERRSALGEIEERATSARHGRIRETIRESQVIRHLLRDSGHAHLLPKMENSSSVLGAVLSEIHNSLGPRPASFRNLDEALGRLTAAEAATADHGLKAIQEIFFSDHECGGKTELERLQGGSSIDSILGERLEKSLASKASSDMKEKHRRRLDELRRAQTAHEVQKNKKSKHRQAADPPQSSGIILDAPPCAACHAPVDSRSLVSCPLCQLRADLDEQGHLTVYCSSACYHEAFDAHLGDAHACAADKNCAQPSVEDGAMECDDGSVVLCSDCLGPLKTVTPYCSKQCADIDSQQHGESVHQRHGHRENGGAAHSNEPLSVGGGSDGVAAIRLTPLCEALLDLEQRTHVSIKPLD